MLISTTIVDNKIVFPGDLFYVKELYLGIDPFNPQALCHCRVEKAKFENCLCRTRIFLLIMGLQSVNTLSVTTLLSWSRRTLLGYFKTISSKTQIRKTTTTTKHQSDKNDLWNTRNSGASHLWIYNWCFTYRDLLHQPLLACEGRTGWHLSDLCVLQVPNACLLISHKPLLLQRKTEVMICHCQTVWSWEKTGNCNPSGMVNYLVTRRDQPLYWQTFWIQERGFTFISEYGMLMTCIMFMTLWNQRWTQEVRKEVGIQEGGLFWHRENKPRLGRQKNKQEHFKEVLRLTNMRGDLGGQEQGWLKWGSVLLRYTLVQSCKTKWPIGD